MNALVLQCGGPTAVVNVSLAAVVRSWRAVEGGLLFGGRFGLAALRTGAWLELPPDAPGHSADGSEDGEGWLASLEASSGMALGGGRDRLTDAEIGAAVDLLATRGVGTLFLIGGNGTMAAGRAIAARALDAGTALHVVGIPKTIDNDIPCTDLSPGFPSAARFLVDCVRDVAADASSMLGYEDVVLIEAMGRHTGWLAGATTLARGHPGGAPHVVLIPELPVNEDGFLAAVRDRHASSGICVATVAEGIRDEAGVFLAEKPGRAGNGQGVGT